MLRPYTANANSGTYFFGQKALGFAKTAFVTAKRSFFMSAYFLASQKMLFRRRETLICAKQSADLTVCPLYLGFKSSKRAFVYSLPANDC